MAPRVRPAPTAVTRPHGQTLKPSARKVDRLMPDAPVTPAQPETAATPPTTPETPETPAQEPPAPAETDWKAEARKHEQRAKQYKAKLDEAAPKLTEYDALVEASKTELERAKEQAETASKRAADSDARAVQAEVRALASDAFADPSDAAAFLTLGKYVADDGQIDTAAIQTDLADLLQRKPHLGKQPASRVPAPTAAVGASAGGAPDAEAVITEAKKKGDWKTVVALENQKLAALAAQQR